MPEEDFPWSDLKDAVAEALDLPPGVREAHLEARCPDPARRAEATRLLLACQRAARNSILDMPAARFAEPLLQEAPAEEGGFPEVLRTALAGRYTIERELGRGGMATVYLARDERHGRSVALKLLRSELLPLDGPSRGAARFQREIAIAARLTHPHIVPLYDSGEVGGLLYYISPYVEGETLKDRLSRVGPPPLPEALRLLRDVGRSLAYAHRQGLVHRDVKPANILLNKEGDALVADFGVAKAVAAAQGPDDAPHIGDAPDSPQAEVTEAAIVLGTPAYMAPEQVRGDSAVDHRADLYAFGAVAYELLTGAAPFAGRSRNEQLAAHLTEAPEPVHALRPDIPPTLAGLVERLLAKDPGERPEDAAQVVALLEIELARLMPGVAGDGREGNGYRSALKRLPLLTLVLLSSAASIQDTPYLHASADEASIAILPFAVSGGTLDDAAFGGGLTVHLAGALGKVPGVRVAAPVSAAVLARRDLDIPAIAEILNVETVLEGSLHREGDRLMLAVNLVDAGDSRIRWSETYDVPAGDLFAVQERIARDVATAVSPGTEEPLPDPLITRGTEDREAYDLYQKGQYLANTRQRDALFRALGYFDDAVARDSTYARAWAGIADAWTFLGIFGHVPPHDAYPRARAAAERAIELDSRIVEAHAALAHILFVYDWNWQAAEKAFRRAIALNPRYPPLRIYYASYLHSVGQPEEALAQMAIARDLDPLAPTGLFRGRIYVDTNRPDAAIEVLKEQIAMDPRLDIGHQFIALAYLQKGMNDDAIASMERAAALSGPRDLAELAYVYAKAGRPAEARRILTSFDAGEDLDPLGFHLAMAYGALGEKDEAFRWLEAAYRAHGGYMNLLAVATGFESLRADPRFDDLLRRMGLR